ncbi:MAG TPA: carbohydrate kinase family protein [Anaerolineaceae bacterium]
MTQPFRVVVAGHLCLDIIPRLDDFPPGQFLERFRPGRMLYMGGADISTGGPVANTGLALNRLGIQPRLVGKLGNDLFGTAVRDLIREQGDGLADDLVVDPTASTAYTIIISAPGVDRIFLHHPGANQTFTNQDLPEGILAGADLLHFGYPPALRRMYAGGGTELAALLQRAKAAGVTTSLDMSFPDPASEAGQADWQAICREALPSVDLFMPGAEELLFLLHRGTYDRLAERAQGGSILPLITPALLGELGAELLEMGVRVVGLKLGERGFYLRTATLDALGSFGRAHPADPQAWANHELWAPCFQVEVAGTTGAGDTAIAGFLSAFLRGFSPEQAVSAAVAVGACNVEAPDALSGVRSWEETLARAAAGWPRKDLRLDDPLWRWDGAAALWRGPGDWRI